MPILFKSLFYICIGNSSKITTNYLFMFKVFISFKSELEDSHGLCPFKPQEFLVGSSDEVCKIICRLSDLKPIVTLQEVSVVNAEFVLSRIKTIKS